MTRRPFGAEADGVRLAGWVGGDGPPVLLVHGGPGLSYEYMDGLADDIGDGYQVASYQQRGLPPSSEAGPFTLADHVSDVRLVLDELAWDRAVLVGHSWGGHLALHAAAALPQRVSAVLAVDTMGAVGDARLPEFGAALRSRLHPDAALRVAELDAIEEQGGVTDDQVLESLSLLWPCYFTTVEAAPPMPELRVSSQCNEGTLTSAFEELPVLESALSSLGMPVGFLVGAGSPMPVTASTDTAERIQGAWVVALDGAGHFPWLEAPGSVRSALDRLVGAQQTGS